MYEAQVDNHSLQPPKTKRNTETRTLNPKTDEGNL